MLYYLQHSLTLTKVSSLAAKVLKWERECSALLNTAIILRLSGCRSEWSCWKNAEPWSQKGETKTCGLTWSIIKDRRKVKARCLSRCLSEAVNINF
jgi:hypothetical protein